MLRPGMVVNASPAKDAAPPESGTEAQLFEEISGKGFYCPEREPFYADYWPKGYVPSSFVPAEFVAPEARTE